MKSILSCIKRLGVFLALLVVLSIVNLPPSAQAFTITGPSSSVIKSTQPCSGDCWVSSALNPWPVQKLAPPQQGSTFYDTFWNDAAQYDGWDLFFGAELSGILTINQYDAYTYDCGGGASMGGGGMGGGIFDMVGGLFGMFQQGTEFVPRTGPYLLHKGEAVIPAKENLEGKKSKPSELMIVNVISEEMVPAIIAKYPNAIINILRSDLLRAGIIRKTIKESM